MGTKESCPDYWGFAGQSLGAEGREGPGVQAGGTGGAVPLRGFSPHQPWPSSNDLLELPTQGFGVTQGMGH